MPIVPNWHPNSGQIPEFAKHAGLMHSSLSVCVSICLYVTLSVAPAVSVHAARDVADHEDRRPEPDAIAIARAAIERNRLLLLNLHGGPNPQAAAAGAAADPNTAHHRHR